MRKLAIYRNGILAGELIEESRKAYIFRYDEVYFNDQHMPAISITLPKTTREHHSDTLFPFFANMVAEGANLDIQVNYLRIDRSDTFRLLEATAGSDTIGAITVKPIKKA
jgi:HipA-like protein